MPTSPLGLRYPALSSAPNVPQDLQNLVTDLESGFNNEGTVWTPALTATTSAPALGTGGPSGTYWRVGRMIYAFARFSWGASGSTSGSGDFRISLPVGAHSSLFASGSLGDGHPIGTATMRDASNVTASTGAVAQLASYTTALLLANGGAAIGGSAPWMWAANDRLQVLLIYPAGS